MKGTTNGYRARRINKVLRYEHVLIVESVLGHKLPAGAEVHHVDGNRLNNDKSNLVVCPSHAYHMVLHARMRVLKAGGNPNADLVCSRCRLVKPFDCFHKKASNYAGRHETCKACRVRSIVVELPWEAA